MDKPLCDVTPASRVPQECGRCHADVQLSDDGLRVLGWLVYDGVSMTGQPLNVRVCPSCQKTGKAPRSEAPRQAVEEPLFPRPSGEPADSGA